MMSNDKLDLEWELDVVQLARHAAKRRARCWREYLRILDAEIASWMVA